MCYYIILPHSQCRKEKPWAEAEHSQDIRGERISAARNVSLQREISGTTNSRDSSARVRYTAPARCAGSSPATANRRGISAEWIRWIIRWERRKSAYQHDEKTVQRDNAGTSDQYFHCATSNWSNDFRTRRKWAWFVLIAVQRLRKFVPLLLLVNPLHKRPLVCLLKMLNSANSWTTIRAALSKKQNIGGSESADVFLDEIIELHC